MDWSILLAFWISLHLWCYVDSDIDTVQKSIRRFKRIIYGLPLSSHDMLNTHYMVALKSFYGCESAHEAKEAAQCATYYHRCGGALVAPDFVITACHCVTDESYYVSGAPLRPFDVTFDDFTSTSTTDPSGTVEPVYVEAQPLHPILNTMSLWMGSVDNNNMPQRRFARSFFPHRLCTHREVHVLAYGNPQTFQFLFKKFPLVQDIGLVRTWTPFVLNQYSLDGLMMMSKSKALATCTRLASYDGLSSKNVKLVPMKLGDDLVKFHRKVMKGQHACLFTGFGLTEERRAARFLRYTYRHVSCTTSCTEKAAGQIPFPCDICSSSIARPDKGINIAKTAPGDSGSPYVCFDANNIQILIGVHSRDQTPPDVRKVNATYAIATSVLCTRDSLTKQYLQYLRDADNTVIKKWPRLGDVPMGVPDLIQSGARGPKPTNVHNSIECGTI